MAGKYCAECGELPEDCTCVDLDQEFDDDEWEYEDGDEDEWDDEEWDDDRDETEDWESED